MLTRKGFTLVEALIALVLAGVVFGVALQAVMRQQRGGARIAPAAAVQMQLSGAALVTPLELAQLETASDDITPGAFSDTALQLRAPLAFGISCATEAGGATLVPADRTRLPLQGSSGRPRTGDSLWWLLPGRSDWRSAPIASVRDTAAGCSWLPASSVGTTLRLGVSVPETIPAGIPLRVTRPLRYAFYRAADGWQLGLREWSGSSGRFPAPQPLAGPFTRTGGALSAFRYFDSTGAVVDPSSAGAAARVARVRIVLASRSPRDTQLVLTESVEVALHRRVAPLPAPP